MPQYFILQHITISISTLSKYVREKKKHKTNKPSFVPVVPPPGTNAPLPRWRGEGTFVSGRGSTRYKCEAFVLGISPGTNALPHLYRMLCTGSITDTNEGYEPVKMPIFPVVHVSCMISIISTQYLNMSLLFPFFRKC
jgi:hypothetical protein